MKDKLYETLKTSMGKVVTIAIVSFGIIILSKMPQTIVTNLGIDALTLLVSIGIPVGLVVGAILMDAFRGQA